MLLLVYTFMPDALPAAGSSHFSFDSAPSLPRATLNESSAQSQKTLSITATSNGAHLICSGMCVLEISHTGWPRHLDPRQDEWIYVVDGKVELEIGRKRLRLRPRESMFIPRSVEHVWTAIRPRSGH